VWLGLIVVVVVVLGALVVIRHGKVHSPGPAIETYNPAPPAIMGPLTHLPTAIINAVGATSTVNPITPLTATGSPSIWQTSTNGATSRPVVFFYGAEFAPYAAAERWPVIVALSRFGKFGPVGLLLSSGSTVFAGTSTFTFSKTTYSSDWINLQTVERYSTLDPTGARYTSLQKPTASQSAVVAIYDADGTTFPLLDVANRYTLVGSSFSPALLAGQNQSKIVADLAIPTSPITQAIVASANEITAAICTVTGQRPVAVCQARGVLAADAKLKVAPESAKS
jgi:hypothetical protein